MKTLNPKQEAFCNEYQYYTYELEDPRNNTVFYVGKGKGSRVYDHVNMVKRDSSYKSNPNKNKIIQEILDANLDVVERIVERFETQEQALNMEADLIGEYGIENLTNMHRSGGIYTYKRYPFRDFTNTIKLSISMLARIANVMDEEHHSNKHQYKNILTGKECYLILLKHFDKYKEQGGEDFMRILNTELDGRWKGQSRSICD